ncbi:MAG TPA: hypothetical protein VIJ18_16065 [Microbacteriaceae bacterium]
MTIHAHSHPALAHACEQGQMCATEGPGHALSRIQLSIASATPSRWQDAIVDSLSGDGRAVLVPVFGEEPVAVWHHTDLSGALKVGDPVSVHSLYGVLAAGRQRFNVLIG